MSRDAARDLTTRARIREEAFKVIAQNGIAALSVRDIARRTSVSASVVIYHFESRQGLIDAVSDWVLDTLRDRVCDYPSAAPDEDSQRERMARFESVMRGSPLVVSYVRQLLINGGPDGYAWFARATRQCAEDLTARARVGVARVVDDVIVEAAILQFLVFAPALFSDMLENNLGCPAWQVQARWQRVTTELLSFPLYPEDALQPADKQPSAR